MGTLSESRKVVGPTQGKAGDGIFSLAMERTTRLSIDGQLLVNRFSNGFETGRGHFALVGVFILRVKFMIAICRRCQESSIQDSYSKRGCSWEKQSHHITRNKSWVNLTFSSSQSSMHYQKPGCYATSTPFCGNSLVPAGPPFIPNIRIPRHAAFIACRKRR